MAGVSYESIRTADEAPTGPSLPEWIHEKIGSAGLDLRDGDILVVPQKIISKAEGRLVELAGVVPSQRATQLAAEVGKPPALVEVVLRESRRVVRAARGVLIVETSHGFICANGGVDRSNVVEGWVSILPEDPQRSAERLREHLQRAAGGRLGVIISDTFGRPWRLGLLDVAIGASGVLTLLDLRGSHDRSGRALEVSELAVVDGIAAGAGILMGKADGVIAVRVRGMSDFLGSGTARALLRPAQQDLFR
jgi:coenzyme F420-0:L-glutamate ligase/coenzyme F420-1:gamma-L-glutamate ligase